MELKFQENFLWGAATSGPQTEGRFKKQHDNVFDYDFSDSYAELVGVLVVCKHKLVCIGVSRSAGKLGFDQFHSIMG